MNRILKALGVAGSKPEVETVGLQFEACGDGAVAVKVVNAAGHDIPDGYLLRFVLNLDGKLYVDRFEGANLDYVEVTSADVSRIRIGGNDVSNNG
jgi:hypothetical protein